MTALPKRGGIEARLGQAPRQTLERCARGPDDDDAPARSGLSHTAALQRGDETGLNQGGFAATRDADHRDEAVALQTVDQLGNLRIASEEEVGLLGLEGTQPG